ncbi:NADH dehydrogenase 1 alpha subcomplex subunit 12 ndufa12/DAP13 [Mactra antiquata]
MSIYLQKIKELGKVIKFHGGLKGSFLTVYKTDALKIGTLKGTDVFGNRYYENKSYFIGRSRWIEFTDGYGVDYDASMIPPEWRSWLQYSREESPVENPAPDRQWYGPHIDNRSGSKDEYVPYSTAKPKVQSWTPPQTDALKIGTLKGTDVFGNRYYENKSYFIGRSRWIEFTDGYGVDYDASMIPPEWRSWLQYSREESPVENPAPDRQWYGPHIDNRSGSKDEYVPYSTAKPKVQSWTPPQ